MITRHNKAQARFLRSLCNMLLQWDQSMVAEKQALVNHAAIRKELCAIHSDCGHRETGAPENLWLQAACDAMEALLVKNLDTADFTVPTPDNGFALLDIDPDLPDIAPDHIANALLAIYQDLGVDE